MSLSILIPTLVVNVLSTEPSNPNDAIPYWSGRQLLAFTDHNNNFTTTDTRTSIFETTIFYPETTDSPSPYELLMNTVSDYQLPIIASLGLIQLILFCCFLFFCCRQSKTNKKIGELSLKIDGLIRRMSNNTTPPKVSHSLTPPRGAQSPSSFNPTFTPPSVPPLPINASAISHNTSEAIRIKLGNNTNYRPHSIPTRSPRSPHSLDPPMDTSYGYYRAQTYPSSSMCRTTSEPTIRNPPKSVSTDGYEPCRRSPPSPNPSAKTNKQLMEMGHLTVNQLHPASFKLSNSINSMDGMDGMDVPIKMNMARSRDSTMTTMTTTRTLTMDSMDADDTEALVPADTNVRPWTPKMGNQTCLPPLPAGKGGNNNNKQFFANNHDTNSAKLVNAIYGMDTRTRSPHAASVDLNVNDDAQSMRTVVDKSRVSMPEDSVWSEAHTILIHGQSALSMESVDNVNDRDSVLGEMLGLNVQSSRRNQRNQRNHADIVLEVLDEHASRENTAVSSGNESESY